MDRQEGSRPRTRRLAVHNRLLQLVNPRAAKFRLFELGGVPANFGSWVAQDSPSSRWMTKLNFGKLHNNLTMRTLVSKLYR